MSSQAISGLIDQRQRFLQFVERRVRDRATAEDLLQAAYIRALGQQASLRTDDSSTAWFYRILRNAIIDHYRHRAVEDRLLEAWAPEVDPPAQSDNSAAAAVCHCIDHALDAVKPAYSEVLREVDLADDIPGSLNSFAKKAGITPGNAAVRAHRARHALKNQLLKSCGACAQAGCLDCTCP